MRWRWWLCTGTLAAIIQACAAFPSLQHCKDNESAENCSAWAAAGECEKNVGFMQLHACRATCGSCKLDTADLAPAAIRASAEEQEELTKPNVHGSCKSVPRNLKWGLVAQVASNIGCFNRKGAEPSGSFAHADFLTAARAAAKLTFYDSADPRTPLFVAPVNRTMEEFLEESIKHGWPSFRDEELVQENVRVLRGAGGEVVSRAGTHLGHNLPDARSRYCINLVSIAGDPKTPPFDQAGIGRDSAQTRYDATRFRRGDRGSTDSFPTHHRRKH